MKRGPLKVFYSYAHEDEALRDRIDEFLELLARQNLIIRWHDRHILAGSEWNETIRESLSSADIILLLISRAFIDSEYVRDFEIPEAMKANQSGRSRVVPILLEEVPGWEKFEFSKLQLLPSRAKPVSAWKDPVDAFADIAREIRRIVKDIIIAGGGPFEFGPHEFSEAELSRLPKTIRERTKANLKALQKDLVNFIPTRRYESNLLIATWELRAFGNPQRLSVDQEESLFYMAQVISGFDLVTLQEIDRDLGRLRNLLDILGPDWNVLVNETAPGMKGNRERFAILYYTPRVEFRNFSGQVILPAERLSGGQTKPAEQFARPPLLAAFRSGSYEFQVCTAHIVFGGGRADAELHRLNEVKRLARYLRKRSKSEDTDLYLLGDFQMGTRESPILDALRDSGTEIPEEILQPTNIHKNKYYDLIGFTSHQQRAFPLGTAEPRSGVYDIFSRVFREEDYRQYATDKSFLAYLDPPSASSSEKKSLQQKMKQYWFWKTYLISDHLPLWAELDIEKL